MLKANKAVDVLSISYIFAAKSQDDGQDGEIIVWKKHPGRLPTQGVDNERMNWQQWILHIMLIAASVGFIYQNLKVSSNNPRIAYER